MVYSPSAPYNPSSGRSPPPDSFFPPGSESPGEQEPHRRRGSFSFLRRTKSGTQLAPSKSPSRSKLSKKQRTASREQEMSREQIPNSPPRIPDIPHPTQLQTFGGENARSAQAGLGSSRSFQGNQTSRSYSNNMGFQPYNNVPIPPIPGLISDGKGGYTDSGARTESMTHRGRYSYASSVISTVNSPRRIRRRRDPTPFKYVSVLQISARPPLISIIVFSSSAKATRVKPRLLISYAHRLPYQPGSSDLNCEMTFLTTSTDHPLEHFPISLRIM